GIPPIIGAAFFSKLISNYKEAHPSFDMTLHEVGSNKIKQGVNEGVLDIGLICNIPIKNESYEIIKLLKDPLMLIVHANHPLAKRESIDFFDIRQESF
ncbi:LysR substrate-binding domain-containing protein, partial [Virgibacillus salexigens]|uniref:LysR substrate-binding domain-containing protein n=1 Tax=Virgibacillus salexigens TaxID=61016 RepID=UPI0030818FC6